MTVRTYDPNSVSLTFFGSTITGFQEGTFINVERDTETFTKVNGVGDVSRTRSHNRGGRITFTLMQTAPSNEVLAALLGADELDNNVVGPSFVKDASGYSIYSTSESWLVSQPGAEFSTDQTGREYMIDCADLSMFTASSADPAINDAVKQAIQQYSILTD